MQRVFDNVMHSVNEESSAFAFADETYSSSKFSSRFNAELVHGAVYSKKFLLLVFVDLLVFAASSSSSFSNFFFI